MLAPVLMCQNVYLLYGFSRLFKKGNMVVHDEYDSKLTNWKMLQLNASTSRSNIELFITDIIDVACYE